MILTKRIDDSLFRDLDESLEVGVVAAAFDDEVNVIRHETVRKN